jgi:hypothetical protein
MQFTIKLSLVGMQLPEKYKENLDVSSEALRLELRRRALKRQNSPYIFQVVASLPTKACSLDWHYLHWQRHFKINSQSKLLIVFVVVSNWKYFVYIPAPNLSRNGDSRLSRVSGMTSDRCHKCLFKHPSISETTL